MNEGDEIVLSASWSITPISCHGTFLRERQGVATEVWVACGCQRCISTPQKVIDAIGTPKTRLDRRSPTCLECPGHQASTSNQSAQRLPGQRAVATFLLTARQGGCAYAGRMLQDHRLRFLCNHRAQALRSVRVWCDLCASGRTEWPKCSPFIGGGDMIREVHTGPRRPIRTRP